jgi:hypothetical protein
MTADFEHWPVVLKWETRLDRGPQANPNRDRVLNGVFARPPCLTLL